MNEIWELNKQIFELFATNEWTVWIFFLVTILLIIKSKNIIVKYFYLFPAVLLLLFIVNPICIKIMVASGFIAANRYVRLYWLFQIGVVIAYACTKLSKLASRKYSWLGKMTVLCLLTSIVVLGNYMFTKENYESATSLYKLPRGTVEVTNIIREDAEKNGKVMWEVKIAVPPSLCPYIRQYDGDVQLLYGRNIESDLNANEVRRLMGEPTLNMLGIQFYARKARCDYIVLETERIGSDMPEEHGFQRIDDIYGYAVYKDICFPE